MSAPPLFNSFKGGTDGVVITAGNSGGASGDAFNLVQGTGWAFESSDGQFSMQATNPVNGDYMQWGTFGALTVPVYIRMYAYITATPTVAAYAAGAHSNAAINAVFAPLVFHTDQKLNDGSLSSGVTPVYSLNQWIRVESRVLPGTAANGESEYRLYNSPEAGIDSYSGRVQRTGLTLAIGDIDYWRIGGGAGASNSTVTIRIRDVAVSTTNWIGPNGSFTNTVLPTVTGNLAVGSTLTANPGTWIPTPSSFNYYWHREDDALGTNLVEIGATGSTYTLASADLNKYIRAGVIPVQ